jgi:mannose-6-phosphate isomerase-like protein (cupin superfamily)
MPDGSVYVLRAPAAASGGAFVEMDFLLPARCVPPPPHVHREQVEEYEVVSGSLDVVVGGAWTTLGPGDRASVPVGAVHTFANRSGAPVHVRNRHRPAKRFEDFIAETSGTLARAGVTRRRDPRVYLLLSKVMLDYDETLYPARRREALPMRAMAALARRLL